MRLFLPALLLFVVAITGCKRGRSAQVHEVFLSEVLPPRLGAFRADMGRYPTEEEGLIALIVVSPEGKMLWHGPYLESMEDGKMVPDPWGRQYAYRFPSKEAGKSYDLICRGPTGKGEYYVFSK